MAVPKFTADQGMNRL